MPPQPPIACSLSSTELPRRLDEMSAIGRAGLLAAEIDGGRAVLRFRAEARGRLAAVVAAEAECCAFLRMELSEESGAIRLTMDAPAGAEPVLSDLVAAFSRDKRVGYEHRSPPADVSPS